MWIVNSMILLLFLAGFLYRKDKAEEWMKAIDKKEHQLYILYPLAYWIYLRSGLEKLYKKRSDVTDALKALYLTSKPEIIHKLFWCRRISQVMLIIVLFNLLALMGFLAEISNSALINGNYLKRPVYGEGSTDVDLTVTIEGDQSSDEGSTSQSQEVSIDVGERIYSSEETKNLFDKAVEYLKKQVLGKNTSTDLIYEDLNFCSSIPGTSITIEWLPEDYSLIQSDGIVCNDSVNQKGIITYVTAILRYQEQTREQLFTFTIMPKQYSSKELLQNELKNEIKEYSDNTREDELLELPTSLGNYRLHWAEKDNGTSVLIFILGISMVVLIWFYGVKELENRMKRRKEQMLLDYPDIINKFTLLVNAGMTIKQAWCKVAEDYNSKRTQKGFVPKYAYEEMLTTAHELQLGLPEQVAYEQYGRRTGLIPYIKFCALIAQNLKKGTRGFTQLLMQEAMESFDDRKEAAKRLGEEAGTKLLFPMMIMLILVFLIIMIPAFMAFKI
ncbi:MAG TPA: type II secretion system F family protein [Mobilitalea sp.]|nr:type II secretion system F family protein [Mobilitalea sp.]